MIDSRRNELVELWLDYSGQLELFASARTNKKHLGRKQEKKFKRIIAVISVICFTVCILIGITETKINPHFNHMAMAGHKRQAV